MMVDSSAPRVAHYSRLRPILASLVALVVVEPSWLISND